VVDGHHGDPMTWVARLMALHAAYTNFVKATDALRDVAVQERVRVLRAAGEDLAEPEAIGVALEAALIHAMRYLTAVRREMRTGKVS
jgi:hypothetical protein